MSTAASRTIRAKPSANSSPRRPTSSRELTDPSLLGLERQVVVGIDRIVALAQFERVGLKAPPLEAEPFIERHGGHIGRDDDQLQHFDLAARVLDHLLQQGACEALSARRWPHIHGPDLSTM